MARFLGQQMKSGASANIALQPHYFGPESIGFEYSKPHPRAFTQMRQVANCAPEACVYIADNPKKDFIAPNRSRLVHHQGTTPPRYSLRMNCSEEAQPSIEYDLSEIPAFAWPLQIQLRCKHV
jgi:hypothetical protein